MIGCRFLINLHRDVIAKPTAFFFCRWSSWERNVQLVSIHHVSLVLINFPISGNPARRPTTMIMINLRYSMLFQLFAIPIYQPVRAASIRRRLQPRSAVLSGLAFPCRRHPWHLHQPPPLPTQKDNTTCVKINTLKSIDKYLTYLQSPGC